MSDETTNVYCCDICGKLWLDYESPFPFFEGFAYMSDGVTTRCVCVMTKIGEL